MSDNNNNTRRFNLRANRKRVVYSDYAEFNDEDDQTEDKKPPRRNSRRIPRTIRVHQNHGRIESQTEINNNIENPPQNQLQSVSQILNQGNYSINQINNSTNNQVPQPSYNLENNHQNNHQSNSAQNTVYTNIQNSNLEAFSNPNISNNTQIKVPHNLSASILKSVPKELVDQKIQNFQQSVTAQSQNNAQNNDQQSEFRIPHAEPSQPSTIVVLPNSQPDTLPSVQNQRENLNLNTIVPNQTIDNNQSKNDQFITPLRSLRTRNNQQKSNSVPQISSTNQTSTITTEKQTENGKSDTEIDDELYGLVNKQDNPSEKKSSRKRTRNDFDNDESQFNEALPENSSTPRRSTRKRIKSCKLENFISEFDKQPSNNDQGENDLELNGKSTRASRRSKRNKIEQNGELITESYTDSSFNRRKGTRGRKPREKSKKRTSTSYIDDFNQEDDDEYVESDEAEEEEEEDDEYINSDDLDGISNDAGSIQVEETPRITRRGRGRGRRRGRPAERNIYEPDEEEEEEDAPTSPNRYPLRSHRRTTQHSIQSTNDLTPDGDTEENQASEPISNRLRPRNNSENTFLSTPNPQTTITRNLSKETSNFSPNTTPHAIREKYDSIGSRYNVGSHNSNQTLVPHISVLSISSMALMSDSSDSSDDEEVRKTDYSFNIHSGSSNFGSKSKSSNEYAHLAPINLKHKQKKDSADIDPMILDKSVDFNSVGGLSHHVNALKEMVILPLVYPEIFEKFSLQPPRGVIFYGPPGTGKTLVARALANTYSLAGKQEISFFMRKGADILSKWVGEAEKQLRLLFDQARAMQPSIIFFDEIDGLAPVRSSKQDYIHSSIVSTLLALMDGLDNRGQVVVIAATNRIDAIDPALRRPGRFDRELLFTLPSKKARKDILQIHTKSWIPAVENELLETISEKCVGYVGADIKALCSEAALRSVRRRYPQIYDCNERMKLNLDSIQVEKQDFYNAMADIVPSTHRSAIVHSRPMPAHLNILLSNVYASLRDYILKVFPLAQKFFKDKNVLNSATIQEDIPKGDKFLKGSNTVSDLFSKYPPSFRSWILIHGKNGMGQLHLAKQILHELEEISLFSIGLQDLLTYTHYRSLDEAIIKTFAEARKNAPSVVWIPNIEDWWDKATVLMRSTLTMMLEEIPSTIPILVLATSNNTYHTIPTNVQELFEEYNFEVRNLQRNDRLKMFEKIAMDIKINRTIKKKTTVIEKLVPDEIPKAEPVKDLQAKKKEIMKVDKSTKKMETFILSTLRLRIRDILYKMISDSRLKVFCRPEDPGYVKRYKQLREQVRNHEREESLLNKDEQYNNNSKDNNPSNVKTLKASTEEKKTPEKDTSAKVNLIELDLDEELSNKETSKENVKGDSNSMDVENETEDSKKKECTNSTNESLKPIQTNENTSNTDIQNEEKEPKGKGKLQEKTLPKEVDSSIVLDSEETGTSKKIESSEKTKEDEEEEEELLYFYDLLKKVEEDQYLTIKEFLNDIRKIVRNSKYYIVNVKKYDKYLPDKLISRGNYLYDMVRQYLGSIPDDFLHKCNQVGKKVRERRKLLEEEEKKIASVSTNDSNDSATQNPNSSTSNDSNNQIPKENNTIASSVQKEDSKDEGIEKKDSNTKQNEEMRDEDDESDEHLIEIDEEKLKKWIESVTEATEGFTVNEMDKWCSRIYKSIFKHSSTTNKNLLIDELLAVIETIPRSSI